MLFRGILDLVSITVGVYSSFFPPLSFIDHGPTSLPERSIVGLPLAPLGGGVGVGPRPLGSTFSFSHLPMSRLIQSFLSLAFFFFRLSSRASFSFFVPYLF